MDKAESAGVTPVRGRRALSGTVTCRRRYCQTEKQTILKAVGTGATVWEVSRQYVIGRSLIHNWRRRQAVAMPGATMHFTPASVAPERPASGSGAIQIELDSGVRVWLASGVTDMCRGFDGMVLLVQKALKRDPDFGHLFVFRGNRGGLIKVLWHDGQGDVPVRRVRTASAAEPPEREGRRRMRQ